MLADVFIKPVSALLLSTALLVLTGCSETARKVHPRDIETSFFSREGTPGEGSLAHKDPTELVTAGSAYLAAGNTSLARLHFVYALKREPQLPTAYLGLGDISYRQGDYATALGYYQKAGEFQPENLEALLGQARASRQMGKLNDANTLVSRAMKTTPNDIRVLNELAIGYDLQGEERLAAEIYREIAREAPDQAAPFNNIGVNLLARGNYPEAIINLSKAFLLNERDERIRNNLAMAFALYGQEDQAVKLFSKTVGEAGAWNNIGYLYITQGHYDDAERALKKALELNPRFYERAQENLDRLDQMRFTANSK